MSAAGSDAYTVLIVDDDPELLQLLTDGLELLGKFTVVRAENGVQGLERFFETRPDCVIIDVVMPELDGFHLVQALRGDSSSAQTPLIILTALPQDKNRFIGLAVGADQYLVKPVTPRDLVTAVHHAITVTADERHARLTRLVAESDNDASQ